MSLGLVPTPICRLFFHTVFFPQIFFLAAVLIAKFTLALVVQLSVCLSCVRCDSGKCHYDGSVLNVCSLCNIVSRCSAEAAKVNLMVPI